MKERPARLSRRVLLAAVMPLLLGSACTDTLLRPDARDLPDLLDLLQTGAIEVWVEPGVLVPGDSATVYLFTRAIPALEMYLEPVDPKELRLRAREYAWVGRASRAAPLPLGKEAFFMLIGDRLEARIQYGNKILRLHSEPLRKRGRTPALLELLDAREFWEHLPGSVSSVGSMLFDSSAPARCQDPADEIDLLVAYSAEAAAVANELQVAVDPDEDPPIEPEEEETAIDYHIRFAVARANAAYMASDLSTRLNHVASAPLPNELAEVRYEDYPTAKERHTRLVQDAKRHPSVRGLRESSRADLGIVLYEFPDQGDRDCGLADGKGIFPAVRLSCAANHLSLAHEVGHEISAGHAREDYTNPPIGGYKYGHFEKSEDGSEKVLWRTIMTTRCVCSPGGCSVDLDELGDACTRVSYFSSDSVENEWDGVTRLTGSTAEDNARAHRENTSTVSGYRCRDQGDVAHVWIKDTWNDEGGGPDPAAAHERMWESPNIWVRSAVDGTQKVGDWWEGLQHAHLSQQARHGELNHVYVAVHNNGKKAEAGTLQLYVAQASTRPSGWVLVGETGQTDVKQGFYVAKFNWSYEWSVGVPEETGYSLMARWNPAGTASPPSVEDVRTSKELVLRSVTTIDVADEPEHTSTFRMVGESNDPEEYYLWITTDRKDDVHWDEVVSSVIVRIDGEELSLTLEDDPDIRKGPYLLRRQGETKLVRVSTSHADEATVGQKLREGHMYAGAEYEISFIQRRVADGAMVGGATYRLRAPPPPEP